MDIVVKCFIHLSSPAEFTAAVRHAAANVPDTRLKNLVEVSTDHCMMWLCVPSAMCANALPCAKPCAHLVQWESAPQGGALPPGQCEPFGELGFQSNFICCQQCDTGSSRITLLLANSTAQMLLMMPAWQCK